MDRFSKEKIIGIDLGTTNSAFAYMVAGKPEVITNSEKVIKARSKVRNGARFICATCAA